MESVAEVLLSFEANTQWLSKNYDKLKQKFNKEWVAVLDNAVLDHDSDLKKLVKRLRAKYPNAYNKIAVEYVTTEELDLIL